MTNTETVKRVIGTRTFTIRENQWGNVYAYIGSKKVEFFFGSTSEQWQAAGLWLHEMENTYGGKNTSK